MIVAIATHGSGGGGASNGDPPTFRTTLVARAAPTPLPAPISGESVVAMPGGPLILGGLDSSSASVSGVFQLDAGSGRLHEVGALSGPLHDAAAAALGDQVLVFGGGTATSTDAVQALPAPGGAVASGTTARQVGRLPTVRSDLSAVTVGGRAYVLGGYDGSKPIDSVLQTADGRSFTQVATLPAPARYMAVAALGGRIYAFGGETASGGASDAIQEVDPQREPPVSSATSPRRSPTPAPSSSAAASTYWAATSAGPRATRSGASTPAAARWRRRAGSPSRSPAAAPPRSARPPT